MNSDKVTNAVRSALAREPRIDLHANSLKIELEAENALILEGELPSLAAKKIALRLAAQVPGVSGIADRLRVVPAKRMSDAQIRDHFRDALLEEPAFDPCGIRTGDSGTWTTVREIPPASSNWIGASVLDGVITMDGQVGSLSHQRLAGAMAWWVPGTRDVVNGLEVSPPETDGDDEITEAVKLVLEKDPLVNADRIRVRTRDATVTLEGLVSNKMEAEMAEVDTWSILGVEQVQNLLEPQA